MPPGRADLVDRYERYLACCNERRFDDLVDFVADEVDGSGPAAGREAYISRIEEFCTAFPDYRWELQEVVVEGSTIAARLDGRGTQTGTFEDLAPTGQQVRIQELVLYRFADGRITHCWGDLSPVVRDALTAPPGVRA